MPFMYKNKPANINRSKKREDKIIHELAVKALDSLCKNDFSPHYIKILPTGVDDPRFKDANPELFFTIYAIKKLGLTWFEVEHWLDHISLEDQYKFHLETGSICDVDERRKYYQRDYIRSYIFYKPKQP